MVIGELPHDIDPEIEKLPPINQRNVVYDQWTIEMSPRNDGLQRKYQKKLLVQRENALLSMDVDDNTFDTSLYLIVLSHSAHEWYDEDLVHLYYGYLRKLSGRNQHYHH